MLAAPAALLLVLSLFAGCSSPDQRHAAHMQRGERYLEEGKLEKAEIEFRSALQIVPGDITARVMIGRVAEKKGSFREAFADYRSAVDLAPDSAVARANLARLYMFANEPESALELVEPSLVRFPNDPELLTVRGGARAELKDIPEAFEDARRAVQLAPRNQNAVALLASLYQRTGEPAKAVDLLKSTLAVVPTSIDMRQILASVYLSLDESRLAEQQLQEIVKIEPKAFAHRLKVAQYYEGIHRVDDAERILKEAMVALPDDNQAKLAYVQFMSEHRSPAEGQKILGDFVARNPKNYDLQLGFGELRHRNGDVEGALATYRRVVKDAGERPQGLIARNHIAAILTAQGKSAEALTLVNEVLQKSARDTDALIMRGNLELENFDSAAAIADLRAVLREQPDDVPILRTLARAHLANGEPALAEGSLRDAVKADPRNVGARVELAEFLMQASRFPAAIAILEETVLETPTNFEARQALTRAYLGSRDFAFALRAAEDLKRLAPDRGVGWYLGGLAALSQGRPDEAQSQFEDGLKVQPKAIDLTAALVRLDVSRNKVASAFARANDAVTAQPGNPIARNMLGELYLATRAYPKAIEEFTAAMRAAPRLWLPCRNLALAQIESGDLKAATQTYEAARAALGLNPELVIDLAALYEKQNRVEDAIKLYEALHERSPRLAVPANNLAMLLVTYRKDRPSLNEAQELTASFDRSDDPSLLDTQGWVRLKLGDLVEALPELEAAAAHAPKSKVIHYHLGMAEIEAKQPVKAKADLEAALEGEPNFTGADEARAALAKLQS
jgi:tetratricopeptide (TPR) repeat protein